MSMHTQPMRVRKVRIQFLLNRKNSNSGQNICCKKLFLIVVSLLTLNVQKVEIVLVKLKLKSKCIRQLTHDIQHYIMSVDM